MEDFNTAPGQEDALKRILLHSLHEAMVHRDTIRPIKREYRASRSYYSNPSAGSRRLPGYDSSSSEEDDEN